MIGFGTQVSDSANSGVGTIYPPNSFFPPFVVLPSLDTAVKVPASGPICSGANVVLVTQFTVLRAILIANLGFEYAGSVGGQLISFGIYDSTGTLLFSTGVITAGVTGIYQKVTIPLRTLAPGTYWLAQTSNTGAPNIAVHYITSAFMRTLVNGGSVKIGTAVNASALGVLPAQLGGVVALANDATGPVMLFVESS